ncbi:MAG: hypothetical protein ACRDGD_06545, partial [Candidatus Limnocylindria bacterium]
MTLRSLVAAGLLLAMLVSVSAIPGGFVATVHAAPYTLETDATYAVTPDDGEVGVTVAVTFTNTTPDPAGKFSVFNEVELAVHDTASDVAASDDDGALEVAVAVEDEVNVATIGLREPLRFDETVTFELTYALADSDDPQLRVRPSLVIFPAWGFGTSSTVRVRVPVGYEVRVDGDTLTDSGDGLTSGAIGDPSAWLALVTALRPTEYASFDATVPLSGGTAD